VPAARAIIHIVLYASLAAALLGPAAVRSAERAFAVEIDAPGELRALLASNLDIARWSTHERMTPAEFRRLFRDLQTEVGALLETQGYYAPTVEARLDESPERLVARVRVVPGEPVRVSSVGIAFIDPANAMPGADEALRARLRAAWSLPAGAIFRHGAWEDAKRELLKALAADRFPLATIVSSEAHVDPQKRTAALEVSVGSGPRVRFGRLEIEGIRRYPRSVVENLNPIREGSDYAYLDLQEFQTRLIATGYFASVIVDAPAGPDGIAPVKVTVEEREPRSVAFGVGYATDTGARVQAEYRQLNVLERGWRFLGRVKLDAVSQSARTDLFFPTGADGFQNRLQAQGEHEDIQGQETRKLTFNAGRARRRGDTELDFTLGYVLEDQKIEAGSRDTSYAFTGNVSWTLRRTNHPLLPDRGYAINVQLGGAPGSVLSTEPFLRNYVKGVWYLPAGSSGLFTLRGELGYVVADGRKGIPSDFLFRTGGDQSVRGYEYESLGIREGAAIVGGRALAVASAEYTHWITRDWGAAIFADAGNAADTFSGFRFAQGYGVGVRWRSPVGPLNVDVAYGRDEEKVRLHFSIGIAF